MLGECWSDPIRNLLFANAFNCLSSGRCGLNRIVSVFFWGEQKTGSGRRSCEGGVARGGGVLVVRVAMCDGNVRFLDMTSVSADEGADEEESELPDLRYDNSSWSSSETSSDSDSDSGDEHVDAVAAPADTCNDEVKEPSPSSQSQLEELRNSSVVNNTI